MGPLSRRLQTTKDFTMMKVLLLSGLFLSIVGALPQGIAPLEISPEDVAPQNPDLLERAFWNVLTNQLVNNFKQDCWYPCNKKTGKCAWCGAGACCRIGYKGNGCDGTKGGLIKHVCVAGI